MGLELPGPGSSAFHRTFSREDHVVGKFFSALVPSPCGPRQEGQFSAPASPVQARRSIVQPVSNRTRFPPKAWEKIATGSGKASGAKEPGLRRWPGQESWIEPSPAGGSKT